MKTDELIKLLQEADPSGQLEVSVGNIDILFVDCVQPWYDGPQQVLIRDDSKRPYFNVVGGLLRSFGDDKVRIHTLSLDQLLVDLPDAEIHQVGDRLVDTFYIQALSEYAKLLKEDQVPSNDNWVSSRFFDLIMEHDAAD